MIIHNPILTGSFTVNGTDVTSITSSAASITAINAYTASQNILNGTYATTGSNTFAGIQTVNSNLVVTGSITAQTLVVQTVTSSVIYSSGSNVFGNNIANTQVMTGSVTVTGSFRFGSSNQQTAGNERLWVGQNGAVGIDDANSTSLSVAHAPATGSPTISLTYQFRTNDNAGGNLYGDAIRVTKNAGASSTYTIFSTNSTIGAGTERMRITATGNVGINTSSPTNKLHLVNDGNTLAAFRITDTNANGSFLVLNASNTDSAIIVNGTAAIPLDIYTGGVARMRITSAGGVQVGSTTGSGTSDVGVFIGGTNSSKLNLYGAYSGGAAGMNLSNASGNETVAFYGSTGNYYFAGSNVSDRRSKTNIQAINSALSNLLQLKPSTFAYNLHPTIIRGGFIAQEVQEVLPDFVTVPEDETEMMGVDYNGILAMAVKAIQELQAQITELKNK